MSGTSTTSHKAARKKTVLLADDESAITILYEIELLRMGYDVLVAHNGTEAARIASDCNRPIDVLVTDWRMPGVTGDVLARQLMAGRPTLAVILMSGYEEGEEIAKTFDPAQVTFLRKPFEPALLDQAIRILLGLPLQPSSRVA
jgi:DNA-binding NtrC family response regulator